MFSYIFKNHLEHPYKVFRQSKPLPLLQSNLIHNSPIESRSPNIQEPCFINKRLKPTRETLGPGIFSYMFKNQLDISYKENCCLSQISCSELCHISYSNEEANSFIKTKAALNLESEEIQQLIPNENDTDNERENLGEQSHEFSKTNQCSCGEKSETNFQCRICKTYLCEECQSGPLKLDKQSKCIECLMFEIESKS